MLFSENCSFSLNRIILWRFQNIPNCEDSYSRIILGKLKTKKILRIRMLVNTGPDLNKMQIKPGKSMTLQLSIKQI